MSKFSNHILPKIYIKVVHIPCKDDHGQAWIMQISNCKYVRLRGLRNLLYYLQTTKPSEN